MPAGPYAHSGLDVVDFTPGTVRADISPALFASLYNRPNLTAALNIGQFGGGGIAAGQGTVQQILHTWTEDRLNPQQVTENDGGISAVATSFTVTNADGAILRVGTVLSDAAQDPSVAEQVFVSSISFGAANATVTIDAGAGTPYRRGFNGTTAATHAAGAVWLIVAQLEIQGSDLGSDQSRVPGVKYNVIQTQRKDVNVTGAMVSMANHGMIPGIGNMVGYQLHQRIEEMLGITEQSFIRGVASQQSVATEYEAMWGTLAFLGRTNPVPNATAVPYNAGGAALNDLLVNNVCINIDSQGAEVPDAIVCNNVNIDKIGRIYRDQLRLSQDELIRGYFVDAIRSSLGTRPIRLIKTNYMPSSIVEFLDLSRIRIIPFLDRFCFLISAPTTRDSDVISVVTAMTMEMRNTGTDFGYAHQAAYNFV